MSFYNINIKNYEDILNIINSIINKIIQTIIDVCLIVLDYLKHTLEDYINKHKQPLYIQLLYKLYGVGFSLINITAIYLNLPFQVIPKACIMFIFTIISVLIDLNIIDQENVKNKTNLIKKFLISLPLK
ncbi:putative integral membrane protein (apicoplast) [Babesia bovis T2Bo]|uniref:Uncharacterized protein n=1 Tax=Babesia bovis TaxID=5865 RepID=A7AXF6_BABBO|nr:putative integral membrane protein [Babesia bovis T2Bo]EDO05079.1 putative integral membrane protein [Babesia bovis T2Bo]|eukprot:YP_002290859.1 hypothetical protein BBOV_V000290 (apicoplast) [Babesia bovis T2Bo]